MQPVCMSAVGQTNVTNTAALNKKAEKINHTSNGFRLFCSVSLVNVLRTLKLKRKLEMEGCRMHAQSVKHCWT